MQGKHAASLNARGIAPKLLAALLALVMVLGCSPFVSLGEVYAEDEDAASGQTGQEAEALSLEELDEESLVEALELSQGEYATLVDGASAGDAEAVEALAAAWASEDDAEDAEEAILTLVPQDDSELCLQIAISLELSGGEAIEAGALQIVIPSSIFTDAEGAAAGEMELLVPADAEGEAVFSCIEAEEGLVLVNNVALSGEGGLSFEAAIGGLVPSALFEEGQLGGVCISDDFAAEASLALASGGESSAASNSLRASIDTSALAQLEEAGAEEEDTGAEADGAEDASTADDAETDDSADDDASDGSASGDDDDVAAGGLSFAGASSMNAGTTVASGTSGGCTWTLTSDGTLTFSVAESGSGTISAGTMGSYDDYEDVPWYDYCEDITSVVIEEGVTAGYSTAYFFYGCSNLTSISGDGASNFVGFGVTDMSYMFSGCSSLSDLSALAGWDVSSVSSMSHLFYECSSLSSLSSISGWDTGYVVLMDYMFSGCSSLSSLDDLDDWDVSDCVDMSGMFYGCTSLSSLDGLENWDVSNVEDMAYLFYNCSELSDISALENWDVSSARNMSWLFGFCTFTSVDALASWDTSSATSMAGMFYVCTSLQEVDGLADWDVSNVTTMYYMFFYCYRLSDISGLADWDVSSVTDMNSMFYECAFSSARNIYGWDVSSVTDMRWMFYGTLSSSSWINSYWELSDDCDTTYIVNSRNNSNSESNDTLIISCTLTNTTSATADHEIGYTIYVSGTYTITDEDGDTITSGSLSSGDTIYLGDGETVTISVSSGTVYNTSGAADYSEGVVETSNTEGFDGDEPAAWVTTGKNYAEYDYIWDYSTSALWSPEVEKILLGGGDLTQGEFSFVIAEENDEGEWESVGTATNAAASYDEDAECATSQVLFESHLYQNRNDGETYTYRIQEDEGNDASIKYDSRYYTVVVEVEDDGDGTMTVTATYYDEDGDVITSPTFVNNGYVLPETGLAAGMIAGLAAGFALLAASGAALMRRQGAQGRPAGGK